MGGLDNPLETMSTQIFVLVFEISSQGSSFNSLFRSNRYFCVVLDGESHCPQVSTHNVTFSCCALMIFLVMLSLILLSVMVILLMWKQFKSACGIESDLPRHQIVVGSGLLLPMLRKPRLLHLIVQIFSWVVQS